MLAGRAGQRVHAVTLVSSVVAAVAAAAALAQRPAPIDTAIQDLASQDLPTRGRGITAMLAQSGVDAHGASAMRVAVVNLLHNHPERAERIRTALIAALEQMGAESQRLIDEPEAPTATREPNEGFSELLSELTDAVSALRDARAVRGLILALPYSIGALVDICPDAVDAVIQRSHEPDLYMGGNPLGYRWQSVRVLGWCLQRPAVMLANPAVESKIRSALLADLDDPEWQVRLVAAEVLSSLRTDPEVRAKLQSIAASDPYSGPDGLTQGGTAFRVRETADRALNPPDAFSFYVTRSPGTRSCRVQPASEAPTGELFIGPERANVVRPTMCSHYDPTGLDPQSCWLVEPANACGQ
jgi:hypothetical protein